MARSKVAQSGDTKKSTPPASTQRSVKATAPISEALLQYKLTGAAFDGGEDLKRDCTAADLFHLAYAAPNANEKDFLAMALACVGDDLELIAAAVAGAHQLDEVIERTAMRACYRIKVAIEVAERVKAADKAEVRP
jgi:hypothetical protein